MSKNCKHKENKGGKKIDKLLALRRELTEDEQREGMNYFGMAIPKGMFPLKRNKQNTTKE